MAGEGSETEREGSGVLGGGNWGPKGREVGEKGEGSGDWVPPCPPMYVKINTRSCIFKLSPMLHTNLTLKSIRWFRRRRHLKVFFTRYMDVATSRLCDMKPRFVIQTFVPFPNEVPHKIWL